MAELFAGMGEVKVIDSPGQFEAYANVNGITMTPEEVIFHFGTRSHENPNEAKGVAKIYLNVAHAKRIAIVLAQVISEYEEMFGEVEPNVLKRLTDEGKKRLRQVEKQNVGDTK
jgi:hypothetical protein